MQIKPANLMDVSRMVFVFGSNEAGRHGAGAAKYAHDRRRAQYGTSFGMTGTCFAIPTMDWNLRPLTVQLISKYVEIFLDFAERTPPTNYQVTCIGCGLGGKTHADIAPMFVSAPSNCYFDLLWEKWLPGKQFWGTF